MTFAFVNFKLQGVRGFRTFSFEILVYQGLTTGRFEIEHLLVLWLFGSQNE